LTELASTPFVAATSANPPPMQKPMIPTRPVQSGCAVSQVRAASMSWKARPRRALSAPNVALRQRIAPPAL